MKGYDYYSITCDIYEFLEFVSYHNISIYRLKKKDSYTFYSVYPYRKVLMENKHVHYQYSVGVFGMIFRLNIEKMIAILVSCLLLYGLSNTIFSVEMIGESIKHKEMIHNNLNLYQIPFFYSKKRLIHQMNKMNQSFNWFEIIRKGSNIEIHYLPRYQLDDNVDYKYNLYAEKEGVIANFDIRKGNKVVYLNQKVNQGDLLVSNIVMDSRMNEINTDVIGKVYAYTFQRVDVEIENKFPIGIGYYLCLLKSRMQIELDDDEKIMKEISLQFNEDFDTISMSNYYVLYENISLVGE